MIAPSLPATPQPSTPSAPTSPSHRTDPSADSARANVADRKDAVHGRNATVDGKQDGREERSEFARMMERPEAQAAAPAQEDVPSDAPATSAEHVDDSIDPTLPDRLLGLLAGIAPAAVPATASAGATTNAAVGTLAAPPASLAAAVTALPGTTAPPALPGAPGNIGASPLPSATTAPTLAAFTPSPDFPAMLQPVDAGIDLTITDIGALDTGDGAPLTSLIGTNAASALRPSAAATLAAATPLAMPTDADAGFDDAFGARIGWMAEQKIGHAQLRVSPDQMGTIDVRLNIDGNKVSAEFSSASAEVRNALENSVGRLRDMLGQHGLQLTHSDVGQGRGDNTRRDGPTMGHGHDTLEEAELGVSAPPRWLPTRGLLDEYA